MRKIISSKNFWMFLFCSAIVVISHFLLFKLILDYSLFTEDDWTFLINARFLSDLNFFEKLSFMWTKIGIHEGSYAAYMEMMGGLFKENYPAYQYFNIGLKIIATLTLFPLILIFFKNRLLAFLTTIIYAINSAAAGSLYWYMKGGIFPGIVLMNLFFIAYYFTLKNNSKILMILSSILAFSSYLTSPTRIFPIFLIIIGIEIYWFFRYKSKEVTKQVLLRLVFLLLPVILISLQAPLSPRGKVENTPSILSKQIMDGNWFNFLSPFGGIGYSLLTNENMKIFGNFDFSIFKDLNLYLAFLFQNSTWIFLLALIFIAVLVSKKPLKFIFFTFILNFILDILMFYLANHHLFIPQEQVQKVDPSLFFITKSPTLVGIFILSVTFMTFLEWLKNRQDYLLKALVAGPVFALVFLILMWLSLGYALDGYNSMHYYHQIPAIGISLFFAAILVLFYKSFKRKLSKIFAASVIAFILLGFYLSSSYAINREFSGIYNEGVKVKDQQILHGNLMNTLGSLDNQENILVYFELPNKTENKRYYKRSLYLDISIFGFLVYWWKGESQLKCVGDTSSLSTLRSSINFEDNKKGFILSGRCRSQNKDLAVNAFSLYPTEQKVFYSIDNFQAYKIEKGNFIDIKARVLKDLGFEI